MAYDFKTTYYKKCRHIPLTELKLYASRGLLDAISRYDTTMPFSFSKYASIYIKGELYYGMSELHPLTLLPISKRIGKQWRTQHLVLYKKMTNTKFMSHYDYYDHLYKSISDTENHQDKYKELLEIWNIINHLDVDEQDKKIMKYKYNFYFQKIRSNQEIGDLLGYSSETIRKKINKIKTRVYHENKDEKQQ
jgi:DNA-directed RNA polymerase specialized sigma subunit